MENTEVKTVPSEGGEHAKDTTPAPRTFTQEEVTSIAAREGKASVEKLLKEAGIAPEGDYKAALKSFREWQEAQKTAAERQQEEIGKANKERDDALAEKTRLEQNIDLLAAGIPKDKMDKYAKLAETYLAEGVSFAQAVQAAKVDFPVKPTGVPGTGGNPPPVARVVEKAANPKDRISEKTTQLIEKG